MSLFVSCMVDLFRPQAGMAAVNVLERHDCHVLFPEEQTCCGQFAFNAGHWEEAAIMARHFVDTFAPDDGAHGSPPVIALSGSCAAMVKREYAELLAWGSQRQQESAAEAAAWQKRGAALAERLHEFSSWLNARHETAQRTAAVSATASAAPGSQADAVSGPGVMSSPQSVTLAYHNGCHMSRLLGERSAPLELLRRLGARTLEATDADQCCGFGGTFAMTEPPVSTAMADSKIASLQPARQAGAIALVSADLGCLLHLGGRLSRRGEPWPVLHIAEAVDLAERGRLTPAALTAEQQTYGAEQPRGADERSGAGGERR